MHITRILFTISILILSCSKNDDSFDNLTILEGVWKLQNSSLGAKFTFEGKKWKLNSGTVEISGTFRLVDNSMNGQVDYRRGISSELLKPDTFTGNIKIKGNRVYFENFSGNWYALFSSWYQKQ